MDCKKIGEWKASRQEPCCKSNQEASDKSGGHTPRACQEGKNYKVNVSGCNEGKNNSAKVGGFALLDLLF